MPYLLALDTSGSYCSVAICCQPHCASALDATEPGSVLALAEIAERQHTQRLLPMVQEILAQCHLDIVDLDAIVYGRGPGSFTGVRIAAGVAQGLAFALDIPVIPISTLATMALQAYAIYSLPDAAYVCTLDARMNEVYVGTYQVDLQHGDLVLAMHEEAVLPASAVKLPSLPFITCGSGLTNMPPAITSQAQHALPQLVPKAEAMVRLGMANFIAGRMYAPEHALPVYLRDTVVWQKLPRYQ